MRFLLPSLLAAALLLSAATGTARAAEPETVHFMSDDHRTMLVAYLYAPEHPGGPASAVVMMHGRGGPYSSLAHGVYDASTLSRRTRDWAELWARQGYYALVVDGFGPRGYPTGFAAGTDGERPSDVNEITVRPLDAYAALKFLRADSKVDPKRVAIQGWSNGGSATLATVSSDTLAADGFKPGEGFKAALAFYPGCGLQGAFKRGYHADPPVRLFIGTADEEVSPDACKRLMKRAVADVDLTVYPGATHDFDDPGKKRRSVPANIAATDDARRQSIAFFAAELAK